MDGMWEKIKKGLREGAALSIEKIDEYTKIGKLKVEEYAAKRKIERNLIDIGERVVDLNDEGKASELGTDLSIIGSVKNIKDLKDEISVIEKKIQEITEEARTARAKRDEHASDEEVTGI